MFCSLFSVLERDLSGLSTWHESIGWRKTQVLRHSLTERFLFEESRLTCVSSPVLFTRHGKRLKYIRKNFREELFKKKSQACNYDGHVRKNKNECKSVASLFNWIFQCLVPSFFIFVIYLLSKIYVKYLKYRRVAHWILQLHSNTWFFILFFTLDFISLDPYMNLVPIINETEQYY